jgi:hypothetical protein
MKSLAWLCILSISVSVLLFTGCSRQKTSPSTEVKKLANAWARVSSVETSGTSSAAESTTVADSATTEIILLGDSAITSYHRFGNECFSVYHEIFTRSGDTLVMGSSTYGDSAAGVVKRTTLWVSAGRLFEKSRTVYAATGAGQGWQQTNTTYAPYTGLLPPAGWPSSKCTSAPADTEASAATVSKQ